MSVITTLNSKISKKKARELKEFLLELDSICDKLYNRIEVPGIWNVLMKLEDIRIQKYVEYYEHNKISQLRGKDVK